MQKKEEVMRSTNRRCLKKGNIFHVHSHLSPKSEQLVIKYVKKNKQTSNSKTNRPFAKPLPQIQLSDHNGAQQACQAGDFSTCLNCVQRGKH